MKIITLLAIIAMLLVDLFGPQSSVGGPMTLMLIAFLIMLSVAIYEAVTQKRGPLGWIVNIVVSLIGGFIAVSLAGTILDTILIQTHFQGSLATSNHPLRYIATIGVAIFTVFGSWLAIWLVNFIPARSRPA